MLHFVERKPEDIPLPSVEQPAAVSERAAITPQRNANFQSEKMVSLPSRLHDDVVRQNEQVAFRVPVETGFTHPVHIAKRKSWPIPRAPYIGGDEPGMKRQRLDAVEERDVSYQTLEEPRGGPDRVCVRSPRRVASDIIDLTSEANPMTYVRAGENSNPLYSSRGYAREGPPLLRQQPIHVLASSLGASSRTVPFNSPSSRNQLITTAAFDRMPQNGKQSSKTSASPPKKIQAFKAHQNQLEHFSYHMDSQAALDRTAEADQQLRGAGVIGQPPLRQPGVTRHGVNSSQSQVNDQSNVSVNEHEPYLGTSRHRISELNPHRAQFADMPLAQDVNKLEYGPFQD
jgi:hypothetical protein